MNDEPPKTAAAGRTVRICKPNWRSCARSAPPILIARRDCKPSSTTSASATRKEQQEYREYALAEALKTLLPILDSLDRALKTNAASVEDFRSGIELIDKQFHDALAKVGVQPIPAEGEAFDPNLHQAVQMVETSETEDNHVIDELQRGYKLKERLLRPAMVRVARNPKSGAV